MNLHEIERLKAQAVDALARGAFSDADALFEAIVPEYERHGFAEGLLALRYNHLLAAVGTRDRHRIERIIDALARLLIDVEPTSSVARTVASGLSRLLAGGLPGIDHEITQALSALAADLIGPTSTFIGALDPEEVPAADALAQLDASTAVALATSAASASWGRAGGPAWLGAVRRVIGPPTEPSEAEIATWRNIAAAWQRDDGLKAFPPLVGLVEQAVEHAPALAAEWLVALDDLEARGLPERVNFLPGLPRERAQQAALLLLDRVAGAVGATQGGSLLARRLRRALIDRAELWLSWVEARRTRGSGRAEDVHREATVARALADARLRAGDRSGAALCLEPSVRRARRDALDDRVVGAQVIFDSAIIAERDERLDDARQRYKLAAQTALAHFLDAADATRRIALVDRVVGDGEGPRAIIAACALAGLVRLGATEVALEAARDAIAQARMSSSATAVAQATLEVELTAAAGGDADAGLRAAEAAAALGRPDAAALAHCLRASALTGVDADDAWAMTATACERAGDGPVILRIEAALAERYRRSGALDRLDLHARRLGECLERTGRSADDPLLRFAPFEVPEVADLAARLVELGRGITARRLIAGWRRRGRALPTDRDAVATALQARIRGTWVGDAPGPDLRAVLAEVSPAETPPSLPGIPRLEFATFESRTLICLADADGVELAHAAVGRAALQEAVHTLRGLLDAGASVTEPTLVRAARALARALIEPFEARLCTLGPLIIAPDGPLHDLPFGLLPLSDGRPLALRHPLARAVERVRRRNTAPVPPPTVRILGDAATACDLRISTLVGEGAYQAVHALYGSDLAPGALARSMRGARVVYLVGDIGPEGMVLQDDAAPVPSARLAEALAQSGAACVVLVGAASTRADLAALVRVLATSTMGVFVRSWPVAEDDEHVLDFLASAASATSAEALLDAVAHARQLGVAQGLSGWASWSLHLAG